MLTGVKDVWNPEPEVVADCRAEVAEAVRFVLECLAFKSAGPLILAPFSSVLRLIPEAKFIYITFGQPHFRRPLLVREGWDLEVRDVGDGVGFGYFAYVMQRSS